jgi:mitochondrial cardiolipin hydrolase
LLSIYQQTFDDLHFSRSEKKAVDAILSDHILNDHELNIIKEKLFNIAKSSINRSDHKVIDWLETAIKTLQKENKKEVNEACFSPGNDCLKTLLFYLNNAKEMIQVCVFTISDDRIAEKLIELHEKKMPIQIITDDEKIYDKGSDIERLKKTGVQIKTDLSKESHMHNKFALIDRKILITGSFNWTRQASKLNYENILVTSTLDLVRKYLYEFDELWNRF